MNKENSLSIRVFNDHFLGRYLPFMIPIFLLIILLWIPLFSLVENQFHNSEMKGLFEILPAILFFVFYFGTIPLLFHKVQLAKDHIRLSWCGILLKEIPADSLKLLCTVGDERWDQLCLTCHIPEELASMEEVELGKHFLTKHDVPFLKRKANYQEDFARRHLLRLNKKLLQWKRKENTLFLPMDPIVLQQLRELYPSLPYKNYTICKKFTNNRYWSSKYAPYFRPFITLYRSEFTEDSVVFRSDKKIKRTVPLSSVRSIIRVDIFMDHNRQYTHHTPVLFLSELALEELAEKSTLSHKSPRLRAYKFAHTQVKHWRISTPRCCNLHCTEEAVSQLQVKCPHAQWLDLSDTWLSDST